MPQAATPRGAGRVTRLLHVLVVAIAFGVLLSPLCPHGMFAGDMTSMTSTSLAASAGTTHEQGMASSMHTDECPPGHCGAHSSGSGLTATAPGSVSPAGWNHGLLATCVAFLVAVLIAALGIPWRRIAGFAVPVPHARAATVMPPVRGSRRTELCVSRI